MTRYTATALHRKFKSVPLRDQKGKVIGSKTVRREIPLAAEPRHEEQFTFKGRKYSVRVGPEQRINLGKELVRQGVISYKHNK